MKTRILLKQLSLTTLLVSLGCGGGASGFGGSGKKQASDPAPGSNGSNLQNGAELGSASRSEEGDKASAPQSVSGAFLTNMVCTGDPNVKLPSSGPASVNVGCTVIDNNNKKLDLATQNIKVDMLRDGAPVSVDSQQVAPADSPYHVTASLPSLTGTVRMTVVGGKHPGIYGLDASKIKNPGLSLAFDSQGTWPLHFAAGEDMLQANLLTPNSFSPNAVCDANGQINPKIDGEIAGIQLFIGIFATVDTSTIPVHFSSDSNDHCFEKFSIDATVGQNPDAADFAQSSYGCAYVKYEDHAGKHYIGALTGFKDKGLTIEMLKTFAAAKACH